MKKIIITTTAEETEALGASIAMELKGENPPVFVALYGDLGAGKTAFTRGFVSVLSPGSKVRSPTYTIVNEYRRGAVPVFHFDFYRIENTEELETLGFEEYVNTGICIAEWSEHLGDEVPQGAILINIEKTGENSRSITVTKGE